MTTDYRALCAALLDEAIYLGSLPYEQDPDPDLITRARAALAQPEPEFTAEEVEMIQAPWCYLAPAQPEPVGPTDEELHQLWLDLYAFHDGPTSGDVAEIARAVLARWGRQPAPAAPEP